MIRYTLSIAVTTALLLSGCSGGSDVQNPDAGGAGAAPRALPEMQMSLPRSLQKTPSGERAQASDAVALSIVEPGFISPTVGRSLAYWDIRQQATDLRWRVKEIGEYLSRLETVWPDITSYCKSVTDGDVCRIPEGTITFTYTQPVVDQMIAFELARYDDWEVSDGDKGWVDQLRADLKKEFNALVGTTEPMGEVAYVRKPGGVYDHALRTTFKDHFSLRNDDYQLRWNEAKTHLAASSEDQWEYAFGKGSESYNLTYVADESNGDKIVSKTTWRHSENDKPDILYTGTSQTEFSELKDGKNGVSIQSTHSDESEGFKSVSTSSGVANNEGGYLHSKQLMTHEGKDETWYFKEKFAKKGKFISAKECHETSKGHCDNPDNWRDSPEIVHFMPEPIDGLIPEPMIDPIGAVIDAATNNNVDLPDFVDVKVIGLPDSVEFFVAMEKGAEPKRDWQKTLCAGAQIDGGVMVECWGEKDKLAEAVVYEERFDRDTAAVTFHEVSGAKIQPKD